MSAQAVMSIESVAEIKKKLQSREYYVGVNGQMIFSRATDIVNLTLASITG